MGTVLVTGSEGRIGRVVAGVLAGAGWAVRGFDLPDGELRDERSVADAVEGCDAVVHAGAIPHDTLGSPAEIMATNLLGTWHVLLAAEEHRVARVTCFSSVQAFGCSEGEHEPRYLPIDDRHPLLAARPYGLSKRLAETMCEAWTERTAIPTVVLRPVLVLDDERLRTVHEAESELGAFVHVDDVADAVLRSMTAPASGHVRLTLCGPGRLDTTAAREVLGWRPVHDRWPAAPRPW